MMSEPALVISIRPRYAARIFEGSKTIELRRIRPRVKRGSCVFVYCSTPTRAVIGSLIVTRLIEMTPQMLWREHGSKTALSWSDFRSYFSGAARAFGIEIGVARQFAEAVPLCELRTIAPTFHPPQLYRYLCHNQPRDRALWERLRVASLGGYVPSNHATLQSRSP